MTATDVNDVFRVRKQCRNLAVACLLFFTSMLGVSVYSSASESNTVLIAVFGGFGSFWAGLSVWMLLAYWRESLCIRDGTITYQGVLRGKSLALRGLTDMKWRTPGTVVLRSGAEKIKVVLDNFEPEQRRQLIRLLHLSSPPSIQRGWDRFCYEVAMPLLLRSGELPLQDDEVLFTRRHFDRLFIPVISLTAAIGIGVAWYLQEHRWLLMPVPLLVLWLFLRASVPARGLRMSNRKGLDNHFVVVLAVWLVIGLAGAYLLDAFKNYLPCPFWWGSVWMALLFCALLAQVHRANKRRWQGQRGKIESAVREWEQQEARPTSG